jgi:hypothetical protein
MNRVLVLRSDGDAQRLGSLVQRQLRSDFGRERIRTFDLEPEPEPEAAAGDLRWRIDLAVAASEQVVVLIGPRWSGMNDAPDRRQVERADMVVGRAFEAAVSRATPVVPVILGSERELMESDLPAGLRSQLARGQGQGEANGIPVASPRLEVSIGGRRRGPWSRNQLDEIPRARTAFAFGSTVSGGRGRSTRPSMPVVRGRCA